MNLSRWEREATKPERPPESHVPQARQPESRALGMTSPSHRGAVTLALWCPGSGAPARVCQVSGLQVGGLEGSRAAAEDGRPAQPAREPESQGRAWVCGGACVWLCVCARAHVCPCDGISGLGAGAETVGFALLLKPAISGPSSCQGLGGSCQGGGAGGDLSKNAFDVSPAKCLLGRNRK